MALSKEIKNEIKLMVLIELGNMFTNLNHKYNSKENHEMMHFLLDIESALNQQLNDFHSDSSSEDNN